MLLPWVEIPVKDIDLSLPLSMQDKNVRIMFRSSEAIDATIKQLEDLKKRVKEMELAANV